MRDEDGDENCQETENKRALSQNNCVTHKKYQ